MSTSRLRSKVWLLLLLSCGSGAARPPASMPVPVPVATHTETVSASLIEIAKLRTDEMKRRADYMQRICATGVNVRSEDIGCTCAPPFDTCPPILGTTLAVQDIVYPFNTRVEGAFTGPERREVALFGGCDPPQVHSRGVVLVDLADAATTRRPPDVLAVTRGLPLWSRPDEAHVPREDGWYVCSDG